MLFACRSSDFKILHPNNNSSNFYYELPKLTTFPPNAQVQLISLFIPPLEKKELIYIFASCVSYISVGSEQRRLLTIVSADNLSTEFEQKIEIPSPIKRDLAFNQFQDIRFSFKNIKGEYIKFQKDFETTVLINIQ